MFEWLNCCRSGRTFSIQQKSSGIWLVDGSVWHQECFACHLIVTSGFCGWIAVNWGFTVSLLHEFFLPKLTCSLRFGYDQWISSAIAYEVAASVPFDAVVQVSICSLCTLKCKLTFSGWVVAPLVWLVFHWKLCRPYATEFGSFQKKHHEQLSDSFSNRCHAVRY